MDVKRITEKDLPLIVFSDTADGIISSVIKVNTGSEWNHVMILHKLGYCASQGLTYCEVSIDKYLRKNNRLKFYKINGINWLQKKVMHDSIEKKLELPWYRRFYDFLGIIGQAIQVRSFNTPFLDYCSEDVPFHLRAIAPFFDNSLARAIVKNLPPHASPEQLNQYLKDNPSVFSLYGVWDSDIP